jgi:hypothetical protein
MHAIIKSSLFLIAAFSLAGCSTAPIEPASTASKGPKTFMIFVAHFGTGANQLNLDLESLLAKRLIEAKQNVVKASACIPPGTPLSNSVAYVDAAIQKNEVDYELSVYTCPTQSSFGFTKRDNSGDMFQEMFTSKEGTPVPIFVSIVDCRQKRQVSEISDAQNGIRVDIPSWVISELRAKGRLATE